MKYNPALDGIRGLAVLAVVAFHCRLPGFPGGFIGVDVFFVLSGFLITTLLRKEAVSTGTIAVGNFYLRRALRLTPALLLMLVAYMAFSVAFLPVEPLKDAVLAGLYLADYSMAFWGRPDHLSHTWSLAVEEHFYLLWPLVVLATVRLEPRRLLRVFLVAFLAVTAWRWLDMLAWADWNRTYYRFDTRASGLILGSIVAVAPPPRLGQGGALRLGFVSLAALAILAVFLQFFVPLALLLGGLVAELATAGLILAVAGNRGGLHRLLSWQPLVRIGVLSYSIYLWHYPLTRALRPALDPHIQLAIVAPSSILLAMLSYWLVEQPVRNWGRERIGARPSAAARFQNGRETRKPSRCPSESPAPRSSA